MSVNPHSLPNELYIANRYRLQCSIGEGGMGQVYLAQDEKLDRQVAIKRLREGDTDHDHLKRLQREAKLLAKFNHPCIVQVYDVIDEPHGYSLVMEYVDGVNLSQKLREEHVPLPMRLQWLCEVASGLCRAHDAGILHRDLKPENVLIGVDGHAKLTDFGIARDLNKETVQTRSVVGSAAFMSPEQVMGEPLDTKSDLFSFGIVAYYVLLESHPFGDTENMLKLLQHIAYTPFDRHKLKNRNFPYRLIQLIDELLSRDKAHRPGDIHGVYCALETVYQRSMSANNSLNWTDPPGEPTSNLPPDLKRPLAAKTGPLKPLGRRARQWWFPGAAVGIVLLTGGITLFQAFSFDVQPTAVLVPRLSASANLGEEQEQLLLGTVYHASQQGVLGLENVELVPRFELDGLSGKPRELLLAVGAEELITADVLCEPRWCDVTLSRLTHSAERPRLKVVATLTYRAPVDRYSILAETVQQHVRQLYQLHSSSKMALPKEADYMEFVKQYQAYLSQGASAEQLNSLERLGRKTTQNESIQTLYREIALDLYHETGDTRLLDRLEAFLPTRYDSTDERHTLNRFSLALAQNDYELAEKEIDRLKETGSEPGKIAELQGSLALSRGEYDAAIHQFKESVQLRPSIHNHHRLAMAHWLKGNTGQAWKHINLAHTLNPDYHKVTAFRGVIALWEGRLEAAKHSFRQVLDQRPSAISLNNLGLVYLLEEKYPQAEQLFKQSMKRAPQDTQTLLNLADAAQLAGDEDRARRLYQRLVDATESARDPLSLRLRAQALAHSDRHTAAIEAYQHARESDPDNGETHYTGALVYTLAGEHISAELAARKAISSGMGSAWFSFPWFRPLCGKNLFSRSEPPAVEHASACP
ncbi:protein kinase domain-containing protein [Marinimicrobium locisalis]|uniref:protein kinase domain-containing protein n=1 Tax=Marinimicrobium locisalis TaxID=546022 RepID=UPI0032218927